MSDEQGQEPRETSGQASGGGAGGDGGTGQASGRPEERLTALEAELREARQEAAAYRRKLRELEGKAPEAEQLQAQLAAAQAELAELQQRNAERALRHEVTLAAMRLGFADPDDAWKLVDLAQLKIGEDGQVEGAEGLLSELLKRKPYLRRGQFLSATNPQGQPAGTTEEQLRAELFGRRRARFWEGGGVMIHEKGD